jgi:DNA-directed RNA polymerase specialized sigma24 family protein
MVVDPAEGAQHPKWSLTGDAFEGLLAALCPDRDAAAGRYLEVHRNLVRLFEWRGCPRPEEYADETMNRCARKIQEGQEIRDVATYAVGVARMLLREMGREKETQSLDQAPEPRALPVPEPESERRMECLRRCLAQLSPGNRDLILHYYQGDKGEKIRNRKILSELFSIPANVLRMRALRLRESLHACAEECLQGRRRLLE